MIGWLHGLVKVRDAQRGEIVLDVGGVGYLVAVSWQTLADVPEPGLACELWIHTHVREEALNLYGFATPAERDMFRMLTGVPQVGPKLAVAVLGGFPLADLLGAVAASEGATLQRIPGVGKRTAERIILDLRDKAASVLESMGSGTEPDEAAPAAATQDQRREEARLVLVNLGWKAKPVEAALDHAMGQQDDSASLDAVVRRALATLMAR